MGLMKREELNTDIKITTNESLTNSIKISNENTEDLESKGMMKILTGTGVLYKPANEPPSAINPNNGAAFEERSNPLSSKGN
jgi:hypothetical protein